MAIRFSAAGPIGSPFTLSNFTLIDLNRFVRPNVVIESHLRDRSPRPVEVPEQEAEIRWGKASSFQWSVTNPPQSAGDGVSGDPGAPPDEDEDTPEPAPRTLEFEETERTTSDVRVENPDDSEQYVMVQRIDDITFRAPSDITNALTQLRDGSVSELLFKYILHNSAAAA